MFGEESFRQIHKNEKSRIEEQVDSQKMLEVIAHPCSWEPNWEPL
jgi:hypothetical protein